MKARKGTLRKICSLLILGTVLLSGCSNSSQDAEGTAGTGISETKNVSDTKTDIDISDMFTDRDLEIGYDEEAGTVITLSGDSAACTSDSVNISDGVITISEEGTYILSGTLDDGMVIVDTDDTEKVQLVLNGVDITSSDSAAIYVLSADKVFVTTAAGSENTLTNGGEYVSIDDNNIDAVIFSKSDLTLNGSGLLTINAVAGHGIVSKDDLVLTSGTYEITAASHGLSGKDSVRIANGTYTINSGKDGIHAENADDADLGFLYIAGGTFQITSEGDGMSAESYLLVEAGTYTIETGGGSGTVSSQNNMQKFEFETTGQDASSDADNTTSTKGIKATVDLIINDGSFTIDSADDSFHSNGNLTINGGTFEIASGDDGIHADSAVVISDGTIIITQSYEGIEGLSIDIDGGDIVLTASDDGLNAAGGNDSSGFGGRGNDIFAVTEGAYIKISGGTLCINASGDGIDSNGDLYVGGGETYVYGPTNGGNGALDYSGEAVISGGIFWALGDSGMAQNFGTSSTQGVMMVITDSEEAGSTVSLSDSSGNELVSCQAAKAYNCVIISCPEIIQGLAYTLSAGSYTTEITMDSLVYGSDTGMGGGGDMQPGGKGGNGDMPFDGAPDGNEDMQPGVGKDGNGDKPTDGGREDSYMQPDSIPDSSEDASDDENSMEL